mmetsp:Transcript_22419/g.26449  ORF Transcript_22419/g.26449 Transcript_22419/m.26449 type:complete len:107 (-) Transcript_22419:222-542(-)
MGDQDLTFDEALSIITNGESFEPLAQNQKLIVDMVDEEGCSLLHHAASFGRLDCCLMMIARGAQIGLRNQRGENAAHLAMSQGNTECSLALLAAIGEKRDEAPWLF